MHDAMKIYWRLEIQLHAFLTSAPDGVRVSFSHFPLYSPEKQPMGDRVGCRAHVGTVENLLHYFELIPNSSAVQTIAYSIYRLRYSDFQLIYYKNYEHTVSCYKILRPYYTLKSEV
jgi:hypothetical protein